MPQRIPMLDPDGNAGDVPEDQVADALKQGYKLAPAATQSRGTKDMPLIGEQGLLGALAGNRPLFGKGPGFMGPGEILKGVVLPTAVGAATGGPMGAAAGLMGGAFAPSMGPEQAAASGALGLLGPAGILGKMGVAGAAAGLTKGVETGSAKDALLTGGSVAAGQGAGDVLGTALSPDLLRKGASKVSGEFLEKFRDLFGPRMEPLKSLSAPGEQTIESITERLLNKPSVPDTLKKLFESPTARGSERTAAKLFENPKITEQLMRAATNEEKKKLFAVFVEDKIVNKSMADMPGSIFGGGKATPVLNTTKALETIKNFKEKGSYKALHTDLKDALDSWQELISVLDPSQAKAAQTNLGRGLMHVGVFTAMRSSVLGHGEKQLAGGVVGATANALFQRALNPDVRALIQSAAKGQLDAVQSLGRLIPMWVLSASRPESTMEY